MIRNMIKKSKVIRSIKTGILEVLSIGGNTKSHQMSPKGLYSKPENENGLTLQLIGDEGNTITIPLQKAIKNLKVNDVILTDDKNYVWFKYSSGIIEIKGDTTFKNNVIIEKNLTVLGTTTLEDTLEVAKTATFFADISVATTALVTGIISAGGYSGAGGGAVQSASNFETTGDMVAGGVSLTGHDHPYTWTDGAGSGNTGAPN